MDQLRSISQVVRTDIRLPLQSGRTQSKVAVRLRVANAEGSARQMVHPSRISEAAIISGGTFGAALRI